MKRKHLRFGKGFRIALGNPRAQAAEMVLAAGEVEGGSDNRHRGSDQWLFVIAGTGRATINGKNYPLRAGTLMVIERGDTHEIQNTGRGLLRTLNLYVPPGYRPSGEPLPRGRP
jgi:mannose-6-phosphate isomerase-like protein (cupin superfamily)